MNAKNPKEVKGFVKGNKIQTQIGLDPDTHKEVCALAVKNGTSFAEQCRVLIEFGLETEKAA